MGTTDALVTRLIRPEIRALSAYHVADAAGYVKLDAMENPYVWPEDMRLDWLARLQTVAMNRYPDPAPARLKALLREADGIPDGMALLLGNGSDEIIQMLLMAVAGPEVSVLAPEPTFVMYRQIARSLGLNFIGVPLAADFSLDLAAMTAAISEHKPALVFLAYPNNPTGNLFERQAVEAILAATPGLVVLDEAYAPFAEATFMRDLPNYPNLLVMRTLSKLGLAGLRLGYLAGTPAWIDELDKVRLPYNINVLTQVTVEFALEHHTVFDMQTENLRRDREKLFQALQALPGFTPLPSRANFILFRCDDRPAAEIFDALKRGGILIKNLSGAGGPLTDCLRVTVGTPDENRRFLAALPA
ncbi:MAG: histidinol-phosphate transaminase [Methylococcaceae bacterium]|nr:MAG: histidinol-phosphate transaminase [Methylococcaceae bacterium]